MAGPSAIFSALYNDPACPTYGFMDGMVNIDDMICYKMIHATICVYKYVIANVYQVYSVRRMIYVH